MSNAAREGVQTGDATMKLVKRRPSLAMRSMFGVLILVDPKQPRSPYPWSSVKMIMKLGLSLAAWRERDVSASAKVRGKRKKIRDMDELKLSLGCRVKGKGHHRN